jgi:hypothetical protein
MLPCDALRRCWNRFSTFFDTAFFALTGAAFLATLSEAAYSSFLAAARSLR